MSDSGTRAPNTTILYVYNPSRGHKILPLLDSHAVSCVGSMRDLLSLRLRKTASSRATRTAILVDNFGRWVLLGLLASVLWRAPLIIRLRGEFFREERERLIARTGSLRWLRYVTNVALAKLGLRMSQLVVCNSRYLAAAMQQYIEGKPVAVVHNPYTPLAPGSTLPATHLPSGTLRLLTVTNMNLWSKVEPTLEALESWISCDLLNELDIQWIICGTGFYEERFRHLISRRSLQNRIHCIGRVEHVVPFYEWCDVLVHLTRMDAFPNASMEAMIYGSPVITNPDSCGTREQVYDGFNGQIVSNSDSFVNSLRNYAANQILRQRHSENGRDLVLREFSVDKQKPNLLDAIASVLYPSRK